jgi:hypothetical protein
MKIICINNKERLFVTNGGNVVSTAGIGVTASINKQSRIP